MNFDAASASIIHFIQAEYDDSLRNVGWCEVDIDDGIHHLGRLGIRKPFFQPKAGWFLTVLHHNFPAFYAVRRHIWITDQTGDLDRVWRCDGSCVREYNLDWFQTRLEGREISPPEPVYMTLFLKRGIAPIAHLLTRSQ